MVKELNPQKDWYHEVYQDCLALVHEHKDFHDEQDELPSARTIARVQKFLKAYQLELSRAPKPLISISPHGGIYFLWEKRIGRLDIVVEEDNIQVSISADMIYRSVPEKELAQCFREFAAA